MKEQLPASIVMKVLGGKDIRVAIAEHPLTNEMAPCIPLADFADAFSYDREAIRRIIERTPWLKKYTCSVMMTDDLGRFQAHGCLFEEGGLGAFGKLQPSRCKDPDVAAKVDKLQEELILVLRDALKGFRTGNAGYDYEARSGKLPHPGLSMEAVADLCKEADRYLKGKASLRALNFFTGMPVEDLLEALESTETVGLSGLVAQYLNALSEGEASVWGIKSGLSETGGVWFEGETTNFFNAFSDISKERKLHKFFGSAVSLGNLLRREAASLAAVGWKRTLERRIGGHRFYRFERMPMN